MNFCPECGAPVRWCRPQGDTFFRHVCTACQSVHYSNPKLVVGALACWEDHVLLCKRAIEPRAGFWTLPAGFMENGETTAQGAMRETAEEACAGIALEGLFTLINIPRISQVHLIYRARLIKPAFAAGDESLEVRLFHENEIPWDTLAFQTTALALGHFFADRKRGCFRFHTEDLL
jgi:ADP-ribose pyrophosphatase YjhB (NUDIX family)